MKPQSLYLLSAALLFAAAALVIPAAVRVSGSGEPASLVFVIDAGHGGEDGGAVGADGLLESDVNLDVALRLDQLLGLCGVASVLTRDSPSIPYPETAATVQARKRADQERRAAIVNCTQGAVLVSIHQNKYPSAGPSGAQVFYGSVPGSEDFAKHLQTLFSVLGGNKRLATPISEEIYLLREAHCPAVLIECGFLSNPEELRLLHTDEYRMKLAVVIAAGCIGQLDELEHAYGKT